jgi:hypothetical protein
MPVIARRRRRCCSLLDRAALRPRHHRSVFVPWHEEQIVRHGLERRCAGVRAIAAGPAALARFTDAGERESVRADFAAQVAPLSPAAPTCADPAGGLPMLLFAEDQPSPSAAPSCSRGSRRCSNPRDGGRAPPGTGARRRAAAAPTASAARRDRRFSRRGTARQNPSPGRGQGEVSAGAGISRGVAPPHPPLPEDRGR